MNEEKNELVQVTLEPVDVKDVKANIQAIQQVMTGVMKKGTHYDKIKGCGEKPVLLKPGAEKILSTFQLGASPIIEDLSGEFDFRYRIIVRGFHIPTGQTVGYGAGEASTNEKKYAWRAAICDEEFEDTPENRRQIYYSKDYYSGKVSKVKQVRQNPADIANTVLKMAKKRALVDLCLTATACSDIFEQDLDENHIAEATGANGGKEEIEPPQETPMEQRQPETIVCDLCNQSNVAKTQKVSEKSPDYKCLICAAVAWDNQGKLSWKKGK